MLSIVAGIICLFRPNASLVVIAIFIAIGWIAEGIAALVQGFGSDRTTGTRVFLIVSASSSILAGLVVAIFPGSSLVLLTRLAGIMLIVIGIAELVAAFMARRAAGAVEHGQPAAPTAGLTASHHGSASVEVRTPRRGANLRAAVRLLRQVLELVDAAHLDGDLVEERREPLGELERLLLALDVDDGEAADDLTGLGERPVGDGDAAALGLAQDRAVLALGDALGGEQHPGLGALRHEARPSRPGTPGWGSTPRGGTRRSCGS